MARLGEICVIESGGTPSRSNTEYWNNGSIPWVKISDIKAKIVDTTEERITESGLQHSSAKLFTKGTILYTIFATLGEVGILDIDAATNQAIAGLQIVDKEHVDRDYLYYFLISLHDYVNATGRGVAQSNINLTILRSIDIPLPDLPTQRRIAATLDKVSEGIDLCRKMLADLDVLVKARFVELFGNFIYDRDKWQICEVGDVADTIDPQPSHRTPPVFSDGVPYIGIAECNYRTRLIDFEKARKVGQNVLQEQMERYTLDEGDFIIGKIGTIGKPFFVPAEQTYTLSANTVLIKPVKKKVNPQYLFAIFQSEYMDRIIDAEKKSTSQPAFGIQKVRRIEIPMPPMELQEQFAAFVEQTDKSKFDTHGNIYIKSKTHLKQQPAGTNHIYYEKIRKSRIFCEESIKILEGIGGTKEVK